MEHDSPTLLFRLACEYLVSAKVIRPGPVIVVKRVAHAREVARQETFDRLAHEFTDARRAALDRLLDTDASIGMTRLRWLDKARSRPRRRRDGRVGVVGVPACDGRAHPDLSVPPAERRRFLATVGRRLTAQALSRREPERRYPARRVMPVAAESKQAATAVSTMEESYRPHICARSGDRTSSTRSAGCAWRG